jgi:hypothetical protein
VANDLISEVFAAGLNYVTWNEQTVNYRALSFKGAVFICLTTRPSKRYYRNQSEIAMSTKHCRNYERNYERNYVQSDTKRVV